MSVAANRRYHNFALLFRLFPTALQLAFQPNRSPTERPAPREGAFCRAYTPPPHSVDTTFLQTLTLQFQQQFPTLSIITSSSFSAAREAARAPPAQNQRQKQQQHQQRSE